MNNYREIECLSCQFIGLTTYAQCQNCGVRHKVRIINASN